MIKYSEIHWEIGADAKVISMAAHIRFAEPTDAAGILAIYGPYCESTCVSFEVVAPTIEQIQERISRITADYPWLVAEIDGQIAGYVYASRHHERAAYRWSVDVAVYVAAGQQRRGVGRILYETLFSILREQGHFKAFAGITLPNPASVGLHESLGFRPAAVYRASDISLAAGSTSAGGNAICSLSEITRPNRTRSVRCTTALPSRPHWRKGSAN